MKNMDRIKLVIASGLQGDEREADIERHFRVAKALVKTIEDAAKLSIEDEGVQLAEFRLVIPDREQELQENGRDTHIAFNKRHSGFFPFPHNHKKVTITWTGADGNEYSLEIEYPVNIEWPIIGEL
jgi:hypothetical protein